MASKGNIVKENIQPKLHSNWRTIPFKESLDKTGKFTSLKSKEYFEEGKFPVIDQGRKIISGYVDNPKLLYKGQLPVTIFGDHTRIVKFVDFEFAVGADGTKILNSKKGINSKFFYYYLKSLNIPSFGYSRHYKVFEHLDFPILPIKEQSKIVDKLDVLFSHLEMLKPKLDDIPTLIKNFRHQVLTYAVQGKLTEDWRRGKENTNWEKLTFNELMECSPKNGAYYPKSLYGEGVRIVRIDSFYAGYISNWESLQRVKISSSDLDLFGLAKNDIIINRVNSMEYLGKCMLVEELPEPSIFESNMMRIKLSLKRIDPRYARIFLTSSIGIKELRKNAKQAVNQASINQQDVKNIIFNLPRINEQHEIIKRIDNFLRLANIIERQHLKLKNKIDSMPQAILNKAFKGELTTQDQNDKSARELLKSILNEKGRKP